MKHMLVLAVLVAIVVLVVLGVDPSIAQQKPVTPP
jgi:hypothetical protein